MFVSRALRSSKGWNERASEWLNNTSGGRRLRFGVLAGTIVAYPSVSILINGPLVNKSFPMRHSVEDLPPRLQEIVSTEHKTFLKKHERKAEDAVMQCRINSGNDLETVAAGSMGVRTGLQFALPFNFRFKDEKEALEYLKEKYVDGIPFMGEVVRIDWNSEKGADLAAALVMSDEAARFVVYRDFVALDGWAALSSKLTTWIACTMFGCFCTYYLHKGRKIGNSSALAFAAIYVVAMVVTYQIFSEWNRLYLFARDVHSDAVSGRISSGHSQGGKEFYWKTLLRNRILREHSPSLKSKLSAAGDYKGLTSPTSLITRYDHTEDMMTEDDTIREVVDLDD